MPESTSADVATKASWIMNSGKRQMEGAIKAVQLQGVSGHTVQLIKQYMEYSEACAASALTQVEPEPPRAA